MSSERPNILYIMTDQQRFDTIAALGNGRIHTPNLDRLVRRGVSFSNAYSTCPVCVPARWTIRTGREPLVTRCFGNGLEAVRAADAPTMEGRCGDYLARRLGQCGYRCFGHGKFHAGAEARNLGFATQGLGEEGDSGDYIDWLRETYPQFNYIEQPNGERTEMYYQPQISPVSAECCQEAWVTERTLEQLQVADERPWFGFASFIGPHPPLAPPIPYNRMYNPDNMPSPVRGDRETDWLDDQIPNMAYHIWAEEISDPQTRILYSRYYGDITYIDACIGRILDAVEARPDADNTLICFFSDHGDHMGDHSGWQKESFFEASCRVPFLLSWPKRLAAGVVRTELVALTDLFGLATAAAGVPEPRDGIDLLAMLEGRKAARERLFGYWGLPGERTFKIMVRQGDWKYIFMANGGREQLFNLADDAQELCNRVEDEPVVARQLREIASSHLGQHGESTALDGDDLRSLPFEPFDRCRCYQTRAFGYPGGFPEHPSLTPPAMLS